MDELGRAELELGANLQALDADLRDAKARVALSVGEMQKMLDSLHADVNFKVAAIEAAASKVAGMNVTPGAPGGPHAAAGEFWGVRGPGHPGSLQNPLVMVQAAGKYFPMGSYAAGVGEDSATDAQGAGNDQGLATTAQLGALTDAIHTLAQNSTPANRMAAAGAAGLGEPNAAARTNVVLDDQNSQALRNMAAAMDRIEKRSSSSSFTSARTSTTTTGAGAPPQPSTWQNDRPMPVIVEGHGISTGHQSGTSPRSVTRGPGGLSSLPSDMGSLNRRTDIFHHRASENEPQHPGMDLLHTLLMGEGAHLPFIGGPTLAGMGSIGSFAGLGPEHILVTGLGLASSATSAVLIGGTLKALGALGPLLVGASSDMLAMRSAIADDTDGIKQHADALVAQYKAESQPAQHVAASVANQAIGLGSVFSPIFAQNALRNYTLIQQGLQPLFKWLEGPQGIGIIKDLENDFAKNLPTSIHAFSQGLELLLRMMDLTAAHTGGLTHDLDKLLTRLNSESNQQLGAWINREFQNLHDWGVLLEYVFKDVADAFKEDKGTADSIVISLTNMLKELNKWENSTKGRADLDSIFTVHKNETLELLKLIPELSKGFGSLYLDVAPELTSAFTDTVKVFNALVTAIDALGPGGKAFVGITLVAAKLGVLVPGLKALASLSGLGHLLPGGGGGASAIMGIRGPAAPGSIANPIAVSGLDAAGNPVPEVAEDTGLALGTGGTIAAAAAVAGSAAVLTAVAYGLHKLDPSIFHFAPTTQPVDKVIANTLPTPLTNPYNPLRGIQGQGGLGKTQLGAVGSATTAAQITQVTKDFAAMNNALAELEQKKTGIAQTASSLSSLSTQAAHLGDVKYQFADKLGAELLTSKNVASKGVKDLLVEFAKLPPGMQTQAAEGMTKMANTLQQMGVLSQHQVNQLMSGLETSAAHGFEQLVGSAKASMPQFADQFAIAFAQATGAGAQGLQDLWTTVNSMLKLLGAPQLGALHTVVMSGAKAAAGAATTALGALSLGGVPAGATGLRVNAPMFIAGEEAPQHPEYVLATNPAYRDRNLGLWAAAGHDLGIPGFASGGVTAPTVKGHGVFDTIISGEITKATNAANAYLGKFGGGTSGGGGGAGLAGRGFGVNLPGGVAGWLAQAMAATNVGGAAWLSMLERQVGRESSGNPNAINLTDINAQHGDPSVGLLQTTLSTFASYALPGHDNIRNPVDNAIAAIRYMIARYGHGSAAAALQFMIANGGNAYARGGRIPAFAQGGIFGGIGGVGGELLGNLSGLSKNPFTFSGALLGQPVYAKIMQTINGLMGSDGKVNKLSDLMSFYQGIWGLNSMVSGIMSGGPSAAIITDPNTGAQSIDQGDVNTAIANLTQEVGWESSIISDLTSALNWSENMLGYLPAAMGGAKGYIRGNLTKIAALQKQLKAKGVTAARKKTLNAQISQLESQNATLGGNKTGIGSGGLLGTWAGYLSTLQPYPDQIAGADASGYGGSLGPAKISLAQLQQELGALSPGALQAALASATAGSSSSSNSDLTSLLEQMNTTLAQQYEVSQAQYGVLSSPMFGLPEFGGSFANGGMIPGPPGAPRTIIAHGGEVVGQPGDVNIHFKPGTEWLKDFVQVQIEKTGRRQAQVARRHLPGRAGALLPS